MRNENQNEMVLVQLISARRLGARVRRLADDIARDHAGVELTVIGMLHGSFMLVADLARLLHRRGLRVRVDFMAASSYGNGTHSRGRVRLDGDIRINIRGRRVLLVDDILDSGRTMEFAVRHLRRRRPAALRTCVLLDKPTRRVVACCPDYVGFTVPDRFVVGYGLDHAGRFRELPFIAVLG